MNYQFNPYYQDFYNQKARDISNAFNPNYQPMQQMQPVCVNISSVDEVRSFRIDPMNTYVFVDNFSNKIYTKK